MMRTLWTILVLWVAVGVIGATWRWAFDHDTKTKAQAVSTVLDDYNRNCAGLGGIAVLDVYGKPLCLQSTFGRMTVTCLSGCAESTTEPREGWSR